MLFIWRGFGWILPIIVLASFVVTQSIVDAAYGDEYYNSKDWPKLIAVIIGSLMIGLLGYFLNYKKRNVIINEETGKKKKSPSHTLFFIPIEFWTIIIPLFFILLNNYTAERNALEMTYIQSPIANDKYLVDYTKVLDSSDNKFKYGVMKIYSVTSEAVEFLISEIAYDGKSGPRKDIRDGKTSESTYFDHETVVLTKKKLLNLKNSQAIYSVVRD